MARMRGLDAMLARHMGVADRGRILPENFVEQSGPANTTPLVRNVYPPWVYKLPSSQDFNTEAYDVAIAAVIGATANVLSFQTPPTFVGYIQIVSIYVLSPTAAQDVTWTLRINGAPVPGYDNLLFPPGVANFGVRDYSDTQVRVPNGARVTMTASNGSANAWTIGGKIAGWFHSTVEEQRIYGDL
jgi:hypothetical protein